MSSFAVTDALYSGDIHENEICLINEKLNLPTIHRINSRNGVIIVKAGENCG